MDTTYYQEALQVKVGKWLMENTNYYPSDSMGHKLTKLVGNTSLLFAEQPKPEEPKKVSWLGYFIYQIQKLIVPSESLSAPRPKVIGEISFINYNFPDSWVIMIGTSQYRQKANELAEKMRNDFQQKVVVLLYADKV